MLLRLLEEASRQRFRGRAISDGFVLDQFHAAHQPETTHIAHCGGEAVFQRAEAFMHLGQWHYDRKEWAQASPYLFAAATARRPTPVIASIAQP